MGRKIVCVLSALVCLFLFTVAGCNKPEGGKTDDKYDYSVQDKEKPDSMFDTKVLFNVKPQVEKITDNGNGVDGYMLSGAEYSAGKTNKAFFWVGKPQGEMPEGGYKAVLLIHGGGGNAFADWVEFWNERGYVALALDINGQMYDEDFMLVENPEFYRDGSWGSVGVGTDENSFKRSWTYMNVVNCILAHNYLRALPYVNENKTVATGISWGGFTVSILSGVDKRFQAFAPVYGCGNLAYDSWGLNTAGLIGLSSEGREKWTAVYDPVSYLPYCTKPILFTSGMTDHAFSAVSHKISAMNIPGKTFFAYTSSLEHGHFYNSTPCVEKFFNHVLDKTQMSAYFESYSFAEGKITVTCENAVEFAVLAFTLDTDEDSHNWQWKNQGVSLAKGENIIEVPEGATAALICAYDEDGSRAVTSTDIFFPNGFENYR